MPAIRAGQELHEENERLRVRGSLFAGMPDVFEPMVGWPRERAEKIASFRDLAC
jgi:hypothetical protein